MENFENINLDLTEKLASLADSFLNFIRHFDSGSPAKSYTIEERFNITSIDVRTLTRYSAASATQSVVVSKDTSSSTQKLNSKKLSLTSGKEKIP